MTETEKKAVFGVLVEIVATLAYQPEIPQQHKLDMFNKLNAARRTLGLPDEGEAANVT